MLFLQSRTIRRQILEKIRERIALGLKLAGVEGNAARRLGPDPRGMIDIIRPKALLYQFLRGKIAGQLVDNGGDHLQMRQLLSADIRQHRLLHPVGHRVPLGQIPHGSAHLPIRSAGWPQETPPLEVTLLESALRKYPKDAAFARGICKARSFGYLKLCPRVTASKSKIHFRGLRLSLLLFRIAGVRGRNPPKTKPGGSKKENYLSYFPAAITLRRDSALSSRNAGHLSASTKGV